MLAGAGDASKLHLLNLPGNGNWMGKQSRRAGCHASSPEAARPESRERRPCGRAARKSGGTVVAVIIFLSFLSWVFFFFFATVSVCPQRTQFPLMNSALFNLTQNRAGARSSRRRRHGPRSLVARQFRPGPGAPGLAPVAPGEDLPFS